LKYAELKILDEVDIIKSSPESSNVWSEQSIVNGLFYLSLDGGNTIKRLTAKDENRVKYLINKGFKCLDCPEEYKYDSEKVSQPGNIIRELLVERKMKLKEFSFLSGLSLKNIFALLNGEIDITFTIAETLESIFDVPSEFWISRDTIYRKYKQESAKQQYKG
jgi:plasmid maintenance system antidote protein VapI